MGGVFLTFCSLDVEIVEVRSLTIVLSRPQLEPFGGGGRFGELAVVKTGEKKLKNREEVMREVSASEISADSAVAAV